MICVDFEKNYPKRIQNHYLKVIQTRKLSNMCANMKKQYKYLLFDCDGVLWRGNSPINGAIDTLRNLEKNGYKIAFITNNSSLSRKGYGKKFTKLGFHLNNLLVVSSSYGTAIYLKQHGKISKVYVIGESGIVEELTEIGIEIFTEFHKDIQAVIIGWDRHLTYKKLAIGTRVILENNGYFIGTNPDPNYPLEGGIIAPGAGSGISALETAVERNADIIVGKPNKYLVDLALKEMLCTDRSEAVFIGDRRTTDILCGINAGIDTILVKTGIPEDHRTDIKPTYIIDSIQDLESIL